MTIDEAKRFLDFISNKVQSGTIQVAAFNLAAQNAQLDEINDEYKIYQQTKTVTDSLATLKYPSYPIQDNVGNIAVPAGFIHVVALKTYYVPTTGGGYWTPASEVTDKQFGEYQSSEIVRPTKKFPIFKQNRTSIVLLPVGVGNIEMEYFKYPAPPKWEYTMVNGRPVYNPTLSVNFTLPEFVHTKLVYRMCGYLSINLREEELGQYSEMMKQQQA